MSPIRHLDHGAPGWHEPEDHSNKVHLLFFTLEVLPSMASLFIAVAWLLGYPPAPGTTNFATILWLARIIVPTIGAIVQHIMNMVFFEKGITRRFSPLIKSPMEQATTNLIRSVTSALLLSTLLVWFFKNVWKEELGDLAPYNPNGHVYGMEDRGYDWCQAGLVLFAMILWG